jgi:hypothetical protein
MGVICGLSTSDFAGDGTRIRNFRHGEAPGEERAYRTFVLLVHEVEPIRKAATRKAITKEANLENLGKMA